MTLTHLHFHKLGMLLLFGVLVFSLFWPHRYRYEKTGSTLVRINNWTGQTCTLKPARPQNWADGLTPSSDVFDQAEAQYKADQNTILSWTDCN